MIKVNDTRGNASHTLGLVHLSWAIGTVVFGMAAYDGQYFLAEYGIFVGTNLAPYVFREKISKEGK